MFLYPFGDFHSLNLGWFLLQFKDWVEKIQEYLDNGGGTSENLANVIAPVFNAANTYSTGDYVLYNNELYKANQAVNPGTWDPDSWDSVLIVDEIGGGSAGVDNVARLMIAGQYSASFAYQKYGICRYNDKLWMANTDLPAGGEAWNAAHWDEITVGAGLTGLRRSLDTFAEEISNLQYAKNFIDSMPVSLNGKKVSIIGDSISTFAGYNPSGYPTHYPNASGTSVTDVNLTWWKQILNFTGATLENNVSSGGSSASNVSPPSFYSRCTSALLGSPDVIFIELGTNDSNQNVEIGNFDFSTAYASLSEATFATAYIKGIKALQALYPDADIICLSLNMQHKYSSAIQYIANELGCHYVYAFNYVRESGSHPGAIGMHQIASHILSDYDEKQAMQRALITPETLYNGSPEKLPDTITSCTIRAYRSGYMIYLYVDIITTAELGSTTLLSGILPAPFVAQGTNYMEVLPYNVDIGTFEGKCLTIGINGNGDIIVVRGGNGHYRANMAYIAFDDKLY